MNLGEIRASVQANGYTTDTATAQNDAINRSYENVCGMARWPFLEKQDTTLTTSAGTAGYTLPMTDWRNLDAVRVEIAGFQQYNDLEYRIPQQFRDYEHVDRDPSTPLYWTFMNQMLRFWPVPDNVYTVTIDYIMNPPRLVVDADTPILPVVYHDVLVWGAIERIAYRERDWLGREFAQQERELVLKRMEQEYFLRQRQTSSHVKKTRNKDESPYSYGSVMIGSNQAGVGDLDGGPL